MKFGLKGIHALLGSLNHPEKQFPSIHIAGTNGKGSTASIVAAILTAAGYKTGLYTSPHLVHFNERIRINGKPIASRTVSRLASIVRPEVEKRNLTFFEAVTAIAFTYFAESKVDIAVVETGLGGRQDATNVLHPLVSVITTIGKEHTQILGTKIERIAFEKGGIIKMGIPCVTGVNSQKAIQVLRSICKKKKSTLIWISLKDAFIRRSSLDGLVADYLVKGHRLKNVKVSLAGNFQVMNSLLALRAIEVAAQRGKLRITEESIREGLENIQQLSGLQGRLSVICRDPLILIDVAHNPEAVRALCETLRRLLVGKLVIVLGVMTDKDYRQIIFSLQDVAKKVFLVAAKTDRSRRVGDLAAEFRRWGVLVEESGTVAHGVESALQGCDGLPLLITGSHFVVGEALAILRGEKYLTINQ